MLLILDDLGIHAKYYRELSLLSGKPPGRDSYPGDIFYQHARILERAGRFNKTAGGGSITALPVIETNLDDFTSYMVTNLMSMTDGHLLFNSKRYHQGIYPAIDSALSVTRVGRQTQGLIQKLLADKIKVILAQNQKLESLSRFGSEISAQSKLVIKQAQETELILNQLPNANLPLPLQIILLGLVFTPFLIPKKAEFLEKNKPVIIMWLKQNINQVELSKQLENIKDFNKFVLLLNKLIPKLEEVCPKS